MLSRHHQQVHKDPQSTQIVERTRSTTTTGAIDDPPGSPSEPPAQDWVSGGAEVRDDDVARSVHANQRLRTDIGQQGVETAAGIQTLNPSVPFDGLDAWTGDLQFPWSDLSTLDQLPNLDFFDVGFPTANMTQVHENFASIDQTAIVTEPFIGETRGAGLLNSTIVSRLPSLEPTVPGAAVPRVTPGYADATTQLPQAQGGVYQNPWRISTENYQRLTQQAMARACEIPNSFTIPPKQALSRYLEGYFRGQNTHMPFLHIPTLDHGALGLELVLSLAAVGAMYRFEHGKAIELYRVAKRLVMSRLDELIHDRSGLRVAFNYPEYLQARRVPNELGQRSPTMAHDPIVLRLLQALLVLMAIRLWGKRELICESLSVASLVATLARDLGINSPEQDLSSEELWEDWICGEERRRTLFVAYVLFSLQSITFDIPPMLLNREVSLNLPGSAAAWKARSAAAWADSHKTAPYSRQPFQKALAQLLSGAFVHHETPLSAFGNYVLIHGLAIQVFLARNATDPFLRPELSHNTEFTDKMEVALRTWQKSWEATHESSLDPSSPKGSVGFNCTAVLRLVHIRLHVNVGLSRQLLDRDPAEIALAFGDGSIFNGKRSSPELDMAILQCIYALSIPVRVGIAFVARTLTLNWSCQHAVSSLECAFLLTHWLRALATDVESHGMECLRQNERKMLEMVISLIREADLADSLDEHINPASRVWQVVALTARLWAETFKGFHVFEVVYRIGESLSLAAETLEHMWLGSLWPNAVSAC
jgi:hypothetical protein